MSMTERLVEGAKHAAERREPGTHIELHLVELGVRIKVASKAHNVNRVVSWLQLESVPVNPLPVEIDRAIEDGLQ